MLEGLYTQGVMWQDWERKERVRTELPHTEGMIMQTTCHAMLPTTCRPCCHTTQVSCSAGGSYQYPAYWKGWFEEVTRLCPGVNPVFTFDPPSHAGSKATDWELRYQYRQYLDDEVKKFKMLCLLGGIARSFQSPACHNKVFFTNIPSESWGRMITWCKAHFGRTKAGLDRERQRLVQETMAVQRQREAEEAAEEARKAQEAANASARQAARDAAAQQQAAEDATRAREAQEAARKAREEAEAAREAARRADRMGGAEWTQEPGPSGAAHEPAGPSGVAQEPAGPTVAEEPAEPPAQPTPQPTPPPPAEAERTEGEEQAPAGPEATPSRGRGRGRGRTPPSRKKRDRDGEGGPSTATPVKRTTRSGVEY